jgi:hypothetical protein
MMNYVTLVIVTIQLLIIFYSFKMPDMYLSGFSHVSLAEAMNSYHL